jgi:hypothetical protein
VGRPFLSHAPEPAGSGIRDEEILRLLNHADPALGVLMRRW